MLRLSIFILSRVTVATADAVTLTLDRAPGYAVAAMDSGLLPKAPQAEEQLRTSYGTGQTPLTEVLQTQLRRLALSQRRVDALRDFHLARVRYDAAIGRSFSAGGGAGK